MTGKSGKFSETTTPKKPNEGITIDHLHRLNQKNISAWNEGITGKGEVYYINWTSGMKAKEDPSSSFSSSSSSSSRTTTNYSDDESSYEESGGVSSSESSSAVSSSRKENESEQVLVVAGCKRAWNWPHEWYSKYQFLSTLPAPDISNNVQDLLEWHLPTASSSIFLQRIIASLHSEFAIKDLNYFLGISAQRLASSLFLSQSKFVDKILERAHMQNCNPCRTPVDTGSKLSSDGDPVCLYMHEPRDQHFSALKRILCYVCGTLDYGLQLHVSSTTQLTVYTNADWARCPVTRRSTSSDEAEYRGVANVVAETAWIRNLLCELHTPLFNATLVYCDNVSVVYMSANPVQHQCTKHIEIDIHFVCDFVASGQFRVLHVPSRFQYADIFTSGLPIALFIEFRCSLNIRKSPAHIEGEY
uniref:Ribonuclease H-like domain-containing protein n=1 Tax=Tanacetum cinerariifolium TaxID=118510 RepID=A0A6L2MQW1_TANCI|nr:ribonuclease H-like domain-containing protein [Tanacetum cinerariifolium]